MPQPSSVEPIVQRLHKLSDAINSSGISFTEGEQCTRNNLAKDGLLDALLVLYDECNNDKLIKDANISKFVEKYRPCIHELRRWRVNLNDFEQKNVIGKGHFGVVKVVREKQTGNVYALKILQKAESLAQQHVSFYEEERDIMAKATSPWITHLQYAFQDQINLYIVMDFHPGGDLLSLLDRFNNIFTEDMTRFYLAEITVALQALHSMNYVHRDIKPDNILIDRCGHLKLADFGSAAKLTASKTVHCEMPVGTSDYIAPELLMAMDKKSTYGVECDFWSLGVMAYEMLYGDTPFKGESEVTTYNNIMNHETKLSFPSDDNEVSGTAKDLIKGLLSEADSRLVFNGVVRHPFFLHTDFVNLEAARPPFIPVVSSVDDTSNFEEFDSRPAPAPPLPDAFRTRRDFSGSQLPFVGFTYTRPVKEEEEGAKKDGPQMGTSLLMPREIKEIEEELKMKKRELFDTKRKLDMMVARSNIQPKMTEIEKKAFQFEKRSELLQNHVLELQKEDLKKHNTILDLKAALAGEKSERAKIETKTLEYLREVKEKWNKKEEERTAYYQEQIDRYRQATYDLSEQKDEAVKELMEANVDIGNLKAEVAKYKNLHKLQVEELQKCNSSSLDQTENTQEKEEYERVLVEKTTRIQKIKEEMEDLQASNKSLKLEKTQMIVKISDLEGCCDKEVVLRKALEAEVQQMRDELSKFREEKDVLEGRLKAKEKTLWKKEEHLEDLERKLEHEQNECYQLKINLQEMSSSLNESQATQDSFVSQQESFGVKLKITEKELHVLRKEKEQLTLELSTVSSREDEQRHKIHELESLLDNLKDTLGLLETRQQGSANQSAQQKTQAQLELLEKQLKVAQEAAASDREKLHITEDSVRKMTKELSDLKLDLRSAERELKQSQETVQFLRERSREFKDQLKAKEEEVQKSESKEAESGKALRGKEDEIAALARKVDHAAKEEQKLEAQVEAEKAEARKLRLKAEEAAREISALKGEMDKAKIEKRGLEEKLKMADQAEQMSSKCVSSMQERVRALDEQLTASKDLVTSLKEICTEQDEQLSAIDRFQERVEGYEREKSALKSETLKVESDLKAARILTNEEKSLRLFQEKRVQDLERQLAETDQEHDAQMMTLRTEIGALREENSVLQEQISALEGDLHDLSSRERRSENERMELENELTLVKEEVKGHIELIHSLKESNFKLSDGLEEAVMKGEMLKNSMHEAERKTRERTAVFEDQELKLRSTLGQQLKLIDLLQAKMENPPKKKATLSRMFGGSRDKENTGYMVGHQWRKLEEMLARERAHTKQLSTQLSKAHGELVELKAQATENTGEHKQKTALDDISNSPQMHSNPKERMRHKIPHRWQSYLVLRAGRCTGCLGSVPFSRNAVKCHECGMMAHTKCAGSIANTCGLPVAFVNHYIQSQASSTLVKSPSKLKQSPMKGWVRVPRSGKAIWEKRFAVLSNCELRLYDQEAIPSLKPLKTIDLDRTNAVSVLHSVPMSELPNTNKSDFPYVFKVDVRDSSPIYLLTSSFEEKQSWISALESVVGPHGNETPEPSKGTIEADTLVALNSVTPLDVNTVVFLNDKTAIVGAVEGLFSFAQDEGGNLRFRARIEGIGSVYEVILVESIGVAVFIGGKDNYLFHTSLDLLKVAAEASQMAKPSIAPVNVEPQISCHLVSSSQRAKRVFMCAAASNRISIFVWSPEKATFEVCRQYSTQEPCSCFQFTPSSLIVGAERFYKINLKNFSIEEYLDESDTSLAYAIYGSAQMSSFPVAIIQVSASGKHEEYLLVFYEFGIFVDAQGRRSREFDLKFVQLPIGIVFYAPHLYILHHNSVKVLEIRPESFTKVRGMSFDSDTDCAPVVRSACRMLNKPRFLGNSLDSTAVLVATSNEKHVEILSLKACFPVDPDLSITWSMDTSIQNQSTTVECSESTSLRSHASTSSDCSEASNLTLKRTNFPNFMRASKRTKKHNK